MSDYNSSLPIRTENVGDVKIQIADATVPSQQLKVNSNGSTDVNVLNSITLSGEVEVKNDAGNPIPISAAALPLPSGASTSALQTSGNSSLSSIDTKVPALGQALAGSSVPVVLTAAQISTLTPLSSVSITGTPNVNVTNASIPVTGTFFQATQPVSASSLPLPTGAATETTLSGLNTKVPTGLTTKSASTAAVAADQALVVAISPNNVVATTALTDTQLRASAVPVSLSSTTISNFPATQAISAVSLPLPSGAATSALQTSGNASLASLDSKAPALGQALAAASVPVVLPVAQITALTPPTTVTVTQATGTNLHTVIDSGSVSISGTPNVAVTSTVLATNAATDRTTAAAPYSNRLSDGAAFYDARQVRSLVFASDKVDVSGSSITVGFAATTKINDYNTVAAVAVSATSTHTYTSAGNFNLNQIETGASGKMKIEVQVNGATKFVKFTSAANSNASIILQDPILVTTGQTVTVIRTNKDNAAQDVYSTISGYL